MRKTIYIIGIKGRTGAMFGHELRRAARVIGVDKGADFGALIENNWPDFIWVATRNPVTEPVKFYYSFFKDKESIPALILSQNGLSAVGDTKTAFQETLGQSANDVRIVRVSLCNQVEIDQTNKELGIKYKLPIRLGFGILQGYYPCKTTCRGNTPADDIGQIFKTAGFKAQRFSGKGVRDMEYSKLFSNLIGMAAAANRMTAGQGLRDKTVFIQEIMALKELAVVAKAEGVRFVNLGNYPVGLVAPFIELPIRLLMPFRGFLASLVEKKRAGKPKDLSEIDYYNGEVVKLGKKFGIPTPVNDEIVKKAKHIEI